MIGSPASTRPLGGMADPRWVLFGGCCLAFLAAALNTTFMLQVGTTVSHLTGDLARFAGDLATERFQSDATIIQLASALVGFTLGALLAGVFIHHPTLEFSRPYGRAITAIGLLLLLAWTMLDRVDGVAVLLAATACGLQNALASHFRGIVLRTTHVTGLLTDFGVSLGMRLRGHNVASWKVVVPGMLVVAFFAGAAAGALLHLAHGSRAVLEVAIVYLVGGLGWTAVKHLVLRRPARSRDAEAGDPGGPQSA